MEIGKALSESYGFARDIVWGKWVRWILLIFCTLFFPLLLGYEVEIYRGNKQAPDWCKLEKFFIDGLKLFVIELIYAIPVIIVAAIFIGTGVFLAMSSPDAWMAAAGSFVVGFILMLIVAIIIGLVEMMGVVRFARTGKMGEAFNFGAIFDHIGKIGWLDYIFAIIAVFVVTFIIAFIIAIIPFVGMVLILIFASPIALFVARYVTLLYDSVPAQTPAA